MAWSWKKSDKLLGYNMSVAVAIVIPAIYAAVKEFFIRREHRRAAPARTVAADAARAGPG